MNLVNMSKTVLKPVSLGLTAVLFVACGGTSQTPGSSTSSVDMQSSSSSTSTSSSSSSVMSTSSVSNGANLLNSSGRFDNGSENFVSQMTAADAAVSWSGEAAFTLYQATANSWDIQLLHPLAIVAGEDYTICLDAKADEYRDINVNVDTGQEDTEETSWLSLMGQGVNISVSTSYVQSRLPFTASASDSSARLVISVGGATTVGVQLDNIAVYQGSVACPDTGAGSYVSSVATTSSSSSAAGSSSSANNSDALSILASGGTFADGIEFFSTYINTLDGAVASATFNGEVNIAISQIAAVSEPWHVQLQHIVSVSAGETYTMCFKAKADSARTMLVDIDTGDPDYLSVNDNGAQTVSLSSNYQSYQYTLQANVTDSSSRLLFNVGDSTVNVQLDDIGVYPGSQCGTPGMVDGGDPGTGSGDIDGVLPITTQGNKVLFGGKPGSIAGLSLFWSNFDPDGSPFYTAGVVRTVKNWGGKLIRAAMGVDASGGYLTNPQGNMSRVRTVVDAAIANDIYVIIDWHTHNAEDYKSEAIAFFQEMARTYGSYDNVIYEVYNEPDCPSSTAVCSWPARTQWSEIKSYAQDVVAAIRAIDGDNLIIVGTPFYSQDVDAAAASPIQGFSNIAYTLHFYAGSHKSSLRSKAVTALAQGIPLFVTEWGTVDASGDGAVDRNESQAWMDFLFDNNISHANWSVSDKVEGASLLKPGASHDGGWSDSDLTESGLFVKGTIQNW